MSNITLGKRPEHYKPVAVKFPMPDGTEGVITATFKYRTRTEYGALMTGHLEGLPTALDGEDAPSVEAMYVDGVRRDAGLLGKVLAGWDVPHELTDDNLVQLVDEVPSCVKAFMEAYRGIVLEGRLGN